jgi:hypothetical protein
MQTRQLEREEVRALYDAMDSNDRPAEIDWVNRTIRVLSDVKVDPNKVLSTGPMEYQEVLFEIRG